MNGRAARSRDAATIAVATIAVATIAAACSSAPPPPRGTARGAAANEDWRRGRLEDARSEYEDALHEDVLASDEAAAVRHLNNAAVLDVLQGRAGAADDAFAEALARCAGPTAETDARRLVLQRAGLSLRRGGDADVRAAGSALTDAALAAWAESAEAADRVQYWSLVSAFLLRSGGARGDAVPEALRAAERARDAADSAETRAVAGLSIGRAREAAGAVDDARTAYEGALAAAIEAEHPWLQLAALRAVARTCPPGDDQVRFARLAADLAAELRARR